MGLLSDIVDMFIQKKINSEITVTPVAYNTSALASNRFRLVDVATDSKITSFVKNTVGMDENYEFSDKTDLEVDNLENQKVYMVPSNDTITEIDLKKNKKEENCVNIVADLDDSNFTIGSVRGDSAKILLKIMDRNDNEDYFEMDLSLEVQGGPYKMLTGGKIVKDADPYSIFLKVEYTPDKNVPTRSAFDV